MLATAWPAPFVDESWWFEVKWDGVRTIATAGQQGLSLRTRRGNEVSATYPEVAAATFDRPLVLDGELVALDPNGRPSFQMLQQRMNVLGAAAVGEVARHVAVNMIVFDLLFDEIDLSELPWQERRLRLQSIELPPPLVLADVFEADGISLFEVIRERDLEGIVGKRMNSRYRSGVRSPEWRKIANRKRVRAVVGGYTTGLRSRSDTFGSLHLGLWDAEGLRWIGAVGSGFDSGSLRAIRQALSEMQRSTPAFTNTAGIPKGVAWVEPLLVAEVEYLEWTSVGHLRAPVFKGFTDDPPETITWESEGPAS